MISVWHFSAFMSVEFNGYRFESNSSKNQRRKKTKEKNEKSHSKNESNIRLYGNGKCVSLCVFERANKKPPQSMFGLFTFGSVHLSSHVIKSVELFKKTILHFGCARGNLIPTLWFWNSFGCCLFAYFGFRSDVMCVFEQRTEAASVSMGSNKLDFTGTTYFLLHFNTHISQRILYAWSQ